MMDERRLAPGEFLFLEGEPSERVALLLAGEVELLRAFGEREVVLGIVGAGEVVGDMAVLEGRAQAASARARTRVQVRFLEREEFIAWAARTAELARELLLRLSERARRTQDSLQALSARQAQPPSPSSLPELRLFAGSPDLVRLLPADGLRIERLPFAVGRRPLPGEAAAASAVDLALTDGRPFRLSRVHFRIITGIDGLYLIDAGSRLGTIVDNVPLGEVFTRMRYRLDPGEHEIIAGGLRSPWRFRLLVGPAMRPADATGKFRGDRA